MCVEVFKLFQLTLEVMEQIRYQAFWLIYLLKERRPETVEKLGFMPCSDSSKPQNDMTNQCQLGSTEWNPGPAILQWGKPLQQCIASQFSVRLWVVHGEESGSKLLYELLCCCKWEEKMSFFPCWSVRWELLELCLGGVKDGAEGLSSWGCSLGHIQPGWSET